MVRPFGIVENWNVRRTDLPVVFPKSSLKRYTSKRVQLEKPLCPPSDLLLKSNTTDHPLTTADTIKSGIKYHSLSTGPIMSSDIRYIQDSQRVGKCRSENSCDVIPDSSTAGITSHIIVNVRLEDNHKWRYNDHACGQRPAKQQNNQIRRIGRQASVRGWIVLSSHKNPVRIVPTAMRALRHCSA